MDEGGGGIKVFRRKFFRLGVAKNFVRENSSAVSQNVSGGEKLYGLKRGGIKIFCQKIFFSQCRNLSQLNPFVLCLRKLPVTKKILDKCGLSRSSVGKLLSYSAGKIS